MNTENFKFWTVLNGRREEESYINANKIKVDNCNVDFIITQAPIQTTFDDFYELIWQENTQVIGK